jgi:5'-nucleotidase
VRTHFCGPGADERTLVPAQYEGQPVKPDPAIEAILAPTMQSVGELKASRLGVQLDTPIRRRGLESPLGNLFTDAFRESIATADIAINNTDGGLRADLPAGPLTYGSLFEVFPFDNRLVRLTLTGREVRRVIAVRLQRNRALVGISGITVRAQCSSNGSLDVTLLASGGRVIADDARLVVVTTDFLATGGDGVLAPIMPAQGFVFDEDAPLARDLVADWLRKRGGRLSEGQLVNAQNRRWTYPGTLPVNCRAAGSDR